MTSNDIMEFVIQHKFWLAVAVPFVIAEAQLLRDAGRNADAYDVLGQALAKAPDQAELLYDLALTAQPACVQTCPTSALVFGNLADPDSRVSQLARIRRSFRFLPEVGTDPGVIYLKGGETNV